MHKIGVIGTGYVGLVSGVAFAETGNKVIGMDIDAAKVDMLTKGKSPIYEPGLEELLQKNLQENRIHFTTSFEDMIQNSDVIFIAVGTPTGEDGSADLKYVKAVAEEIGEKIESYKIIVDKSTVPVGTGAWVEGIIRDKLKVRGLNVEFDVVSNPEFLKEGAAIKDFMEPDRVVIGTDSAKAREVMGSLYQPFTKTGGPIVFMDRVSAELTKYAANAFLAVKVSFINEIANLAEKVGADITKVREGIGHDQRIGHHFLNPGPGFGGSCFPKDVKALIHTAKESGQSLHLLDSVEKINKVQKSVIGNKIKYIFNDDLKGKTVALWGLAFKAKTDDMRESPAIDFVEFMLNNGAKVQAFDPEAMENAKKIFGDKITFVEDQYKALAGADVVAILTEWPEFRSPNFSWLKQHLKRPLVVDGRNLYDLDMMEREGFEYHSIGRRSVGVK